jgi:hypothetical protein
VVIVVDAGAGCIAGVAGASSAFLHPTKEIAAANSKGSMSFFIVVTSYCRRFSLSEFL